jgi:hypothetical protein
VSASYLSILGTRVVDLLTAALTIFSQGFNLVLLAQIAHTNAGLEGTEQVSVLHIEGPITSVGYR